MKKLISLLCFLYGIMGMGTAQNINNVCPYAYSLQKSEYFIDKDPGLGNGTAIPMNAGDSISLTNVSYVVTGLSTGTHKLYARVCDSLGRWSTAKAYPFWVNDTTQSNAPSNVKNVYQYAYSLQKAECFIDKDPGLGNGTAIPMTAGDSIFLTNVSYVVTGLSTGTHKLYARVCDSLGRWSTAKAYPFWVNDTTQSNAPSNVKNVYQYAYSLQKAEYFIDKDPGLGNGTAIPMTAGDSISLTNVSYVVTGLSTGTHKLYARVCDSLGRWSTAQAYPFWVNDTTSNKHNIDSLAYTPNSKLIYGEYYLGSIDPGYGNGQPFVFDADTTINLTGSVLMDTLLPGTHMLSYRFKSSQNFWGITERFTFEVCLNPPPFPDAVSTGVICGGIGTATLKASGKTKQKYAWYSNSWGGTPLASENDSVFTTPTIISSTNYYIAEIGSTCNGPRKVAQVTVYQVLPKPDVFTQIRCGAGIFLCKPKTKISGLTIRWYNTDTSKTYFAQGDSIITDSLTASSTSIYASSVTIDGSCESTNKTAFLLIVKACTPQTITFPVIRDQIYGFDTYYKLDATASSGFKVKYTIIQGPVRISNDTLYPTGIGEVVIKAYQLGDSLNINEAPIVIRTFRVLAGSATLLVEIPNPLCSGRELKFTSTAILDGKYEWSGPNGFTSQLQSPSIYNVSFADTGIYRVNVISPTDTLFTTVKVKVVKSPTLLDLNSRQQSLCNNSYTLFTKGDSIVNYQWFYNAKKLVGNIDSLLVPSLTGVYSVTGANAAGCGISSSPLYVNVDPDSLPTIAKLRTPSRLKSSPADKYQWYINNYYITSSNKQELPIYVNGRYKIKTVDKKGCEHFSLEYTINDDNLSELKTNMVQDSSVTFADLTENNAILSPNPSAEIFNIHWSIPSRGTVTIQVFNAQGMLIKSISALKTVELFDYDLALTDFSNGIYYLHMMIDDKIHHQSIVKK
jgi:hypothetical protein